MNNIIAGKDARVIVGGYDLTGDHNRITFADARSAHDLTEFGDEVQRFILGRRNTTLTHEGYFNPSIGRSHPILKDMSVDGVVSVLLEEQGIVYSLPVRQTRYQSMPRAGGYVPFTGVFTTRGEPGGWGQLLKSPESFTNGFAGSVIDLLSVQSSIWGNTVWGSAAVWGGDEFAVFLHVLTPAASDTYTFTVEGSTTGSFSGEQMTVATFNLDGQQAKSENLTLADTLPRYVRARATRTGTVGDTASVLMSLARTR
ncbi:MAG: hypothetical protein AAF653_09935 [Chloroflexota bacterium]